MNIVLCSRRKYMRNRTNPEGAPASIADCVVTLAQNSYPYTGQPITPQVTVTYNGATLVVNTDYTVSYNDNTNVGAATVTVTGIGEFVGSQVKTFQITSAAPEPITPWNFDITKTTYVGENNINVGSVQNQIVAGSYAIRDSSNKIVGIGLVTSNWLMNRFCVINNIPKDDNDEYHIANVESASSTSGGAGGSYLRAGCVSFDCKNVYWFKDDSYVFTIRQQVLSSSGDLSSVIETKDSSSISLASAYNKFTISSNGRYIFLLNKPSGGEGDQYYIISRIEMTTPFDISTLDVLSKIDVNIQQSQSGSCGGIAISDDGYVILVCINGTRLEKIVMTTPYDISTAEKRASFVLSSGGVDGITVSPDAKSLFIAKRASSIVEYSLSE